MSYKIVDNIWDEITIINGGAFVLVVDEKLFEIYEDRLRKFEDRLILLRAGEENKNIENLQYIYEKFIDLNITRDMMIIALGGGVIGDMVGFASATFKRGIDYVQIPTTLLSQVDSSVGGKTAIDFMGYKNIIGAFHFPVTSLIDINFLKTLTRRDILSGYGEVLKYGLIDDYEFFKYSSLNFEGLLNLEGDILLNLVKKSIDIKDRIVKKDRFDRGKRRNLNFGHTVGHALESYYKYSKYNHGEAVIIGMMIESYIALKRDYIDEEFYGEVLSSMVDLVKYEEIERLEDFMAFVREDKKNEKTKINMVLPIDRGKVDIFIVEESEIEDAILNFRGEIIV